jgi:hypothetical protein
VRLGAREVFEKTNPFGPDRSDGAGNLKKRTQFQESARLLQFEANLGGGVPCGNAEIEKTNPI